MTACFTMGASDDFSVKKLFIFLLTLPLEEKIHYKYKEGGEVCFASESFPR